MAQTSSKQVSGQIVSGQSYKETILSLSWNSQLGSWGQTLRCGSANVVHVQHIGAQWLGDWTFRVKCTCNQILGLPLF